MNNHRSHRQKKKSTSAKMTHSNLQRKKPQPFFESDTAKVESQTASFDFARLPLQAKLTVGEANDKYEREADKVAAQVVKAINQPQPQNVVQKQSIHAPTSLQGGNGNKDVQRQTDEEELQMKPVSTIQRSDPPEGEKPEEEVDLQRSSVSTVQRVEQEGGEITSELEAEIQSARGHGQSLDPDLQKSMGQVMGADFSNVKIHTDSKSDQLNRSVQARAFATGKDVFFRQGEYNPSSKSGQELIAHELTHVVQQSGASVQKKSMVETSARPSLQSKLTKQSQSAESDENTRSPEASPKSGYKIDVGSNIGVRVNASNQIPKGESSDNDAITTGTVGFSWQNPGNKDTGPFGSARYSPSFKNVKSTPGKDKTSPVTLTFDLDVHAPWGVIDGGRTDVPSGTSPVVTAENYQQIVRDLTPRLSGGSWRAPRRQYWSKEICERHEKYHTTDYRDWTQSTGRQIVTDYLKSQTIPGDNIDQEVSTLMASALRVLKKERVLWFRGPAGTAYVDYPGEIRANMDGKGPYEALAAAVKEQGEKLSIKTRPRSNAISEPTPKTRPRSNAISEDRLD